ncbi:MAG TPA: hypothetical protein VN324_01880 [Quisquiliibacterium sp.]|nr:hypothetical protein [Quisquiliibacterium sp.]
MRSLPFSARNAAAAIALIAISGCAITEKSLQEQGMKPLGESELRSLYSRETAFRWTSVRASGTGRSWPDGRALADWQGGSAPGSYRIDGGHFCSRYGSDPENCMRMYKTGDREYKTFLVRDGSWYSTMVRTD